MNISENGDTDGINRMEPVMNKDELRRKTCCGIVLFNPQYEQLKKNIDSLYGQTDKLLLVDNHSDNCAEIAVLAEQYEGVELIWNDHNSGIAAALNQILDFAQEHRYDWYITMDQDSCCSGNLVESYAEALEAVPDAAVLCPFVLNNRKITFDEYKAAQLPVIETICDPVVCITSGSLNRVECARRVGGYKTELFIDCVDIEYNIRLLRAGCSIVRINGAYMFQQMGEGREVALFRSLYKKTHKTIFRSLSVTPVYNDMRLYYIARNSRYVRKRYKRAAGKRMSAPWMTFQFVYYTLTYPRGRSRRKMWAAVFRGLRDSRKIKDGIGC